MKKIILGKYIEFAPGSDYPSIKEDFATQPYENQEKIAQYLENGKTTFVSAALPTDVITGKRMNGELFGMTDGEYYWMSHLSYYVRKYNLRLPEDFERKVLCR